MKKKLWRHNQNPDIGPDESFDGLKKLLGDGHDLSFAFRLAFEEGPWHHAQANQILVVAFLSGLRRIAARLGVSIAPYEGDVTEIAMHHPPHHRHIGANGVYPIDLPVNLLIELAGGDEQRAEEMVEALSEGAPHHVMTNVILLCLAEAFASLATRKDGAEKVEA
jgi:hypothetical protein